jgi:anti-sigma factor RsiW
MPILGHPFVCREMVELITDYLEGALPRGKRRRFEAHLAGCEHCSEYLEQMRRTIALTGRLRAEDLTAEMSAKFAAIYRRWQAEDDPPERVV